MNLRQGARPKVARIVCLSLWAITSLVLSLAAAEVSSEVQVLEIQGVVKVQQAGAASWMSLTTTNDVLHPHDRVRTDRQSRITLRWSDQSVVPVAPLTELEILPPDQPSSLSGLHLISGIISFFHRDKPGRIKVITHGTVAGIEGTEFVLAATGPEGSNRITLSVLDGKVLMTNEHGSLRLFSDQQGVVEPGKPPVRSPGFIANNVLQWCFYYPGVLNPEDLPLTDAEKAALNDSLNSYRSGDLLQALQKYPDGRDGVSEAEKVYHAALFLSVGEVEQTETELAGLAATNETNNVTRCADALRLLIAAVKRQTRPAPSNPHLATELLASSYYQQSLAQGDVTLLAALDFAKRATATAPQFGFAQERVAEMEFSFGHTREASEALARSLELSPRNAQALALNGFLLTAENRPGAAMDWFNRAIAADPSLGNAWLGRGLCKIRLGWRGSEPHAIRDTLFSIPPSALQDLTVAAALEPQRALLRSYLGKAYADAGQEKLADHELQLGIKLDPKDPTGWLYSALLKQQENRINQAISDLEKSQELNDNRAVFRSSLLLDEDRAVKSANLASIYRDAGMSDVSVREAAKAVTYDYANDSAHLFLSDSYNDLRDPTRFNLRYETVWFNELLLANLLSPIGGGRLPLHVSQQEYSSLFQSDGLHLASTTAGRSDNDSIVEQVSQYGTIGWTSYSLDLDYQHNGGIRPNNELDDIEWYSTVKQQVTSQDTALGLVKYEDYHSGDNFQYYNQNQARKHFNFDEHQEPILVGGWHHEWGPGNHTLVLGGRLQTEQDITDKAARQLMLIENSSGQIYASDSQPFDVAYHESLEIYFAELNHIVQYERVTLSIGGRWQNGNFNTHAKFTNPPPALSILFSDPVANAEFDENFNRLTGYTYLTIEPIDHLWLTGGFAYDDLTYPNNFRNPPITPGDAHTYQLGPKAGVVWNPITMLTLRGDYTKSLGGVSLDESYRLEQTQVAGFPQAFRSLIPESVVGSVSAPEYETFGAALDLKFPTRTYAGIEFQRLKCDVDRTIGYLSLNNGLIPFVPAGTTELLHYRENLFTVSISQLLGSMFVVGTGFKYDQVELFDVLPNVPTSALPSAHQDQTADLYAISGYVLMNHPCGLFARADATWYKQRNTGYNPSLPGDDFFQENIFLGYRFFRRRIEVTFGILNLSNEDYHLNPLNTYAELPRERTYTARLSFIF